MTIFQNFGASIKEWLRKKIVSLKRNPKIIPLVVMAIAFCYYSLKLGTISQCTLQIQAPNMGLSEFVIMLFGVLSLVCILNAFPRRKKVNIPMLVIAVVMILISIYCDIYYTECIYEWWGKYPDRRPDYVQNAYNAMFVHVYIVVAGLVVLALMPVYSRLLKKINTASTVEENDNMHAIELSEG